MSDTSQRNIFKEDVFIKYYKKENKNVALYCNWLL